MRKYIFFTVGIGIIAGFFLAHSTTQVFAQAASIWYPTANYMRPVNNNWGLLVPGLATSSTGCLKVNSNGWVTATGSACGGGGSFPFNEGTNYNQLTYSTTTLISFQGGLAASSTSYFVNASTSKQTIFSNLWLPSLTSGLLGVDANGLVYKGATTTFASPLNYSANQVTLDTSGAWSGNAGTASALAADPSNCSAGTFAAGITVNGTAEGCTDVWTEAENTSAAYISGVTADSPLSGSGTAASHLTLGTVGFGNGGTNNTGLGSTRALLWSNGTSILGTSTPTAAQYYATSTIATSTFLGFFGIGTSTPDATAWFIVGSTTNNYFKIDKFSGNLTVNSQATSTFQRGVKASAFDATAGTSTLAGLYITGGGIRTQLDCSGLTNSGKLTTNSNGDVICGNDISTGGGAVTGSGADTQLTYWTGASSVSGSTAFTVNYNRGSIGIGTTTPWSVLQLASSTQPQLLLSDPSGTTHQHWFASTTNNGLDLVFGKLSSNFSSQTEVLRLAGQNNYVSIGTTSPNAVLTITGFGSQGLNLSRDTATAANSPRIFFSSQNTSYNIANIGDKLAFEYGGGVTTMSDGSIGAVLDSTGNWGIGTTTPYAKLSVEGTGVFGNQAYASFFTATSTTATSTFLGVLGVGTSTPDTRASFIVGTSTNNYFKIDKVTGNLTIQSQATSTFQRGLAIQNGAIDQQGTATSTFANGINLSGGCFAINGACVSGGGGVTGSGAANQVAYWSSASALTGTSLFKFDGANLGIGTATPGVMLSVEGRGIIGDYLTTSNIIATSSTATSTFAGGFGFGTTSPFWPISSARNMVFGAAQWAGLIASTTGGTTQTVDWNNGNTQRFILEANTNFVINSTSSNPIDGGWYTLKVCQPPAGSKTATFVTPGQLRWNIATTTISATANTCTFILFNYDARFGVYSGIASTTGILMQ